MATAASLSPTAPAFPAPANEEALTSPQSLATDASRSTNTPSASDQQTIIANNLAPKQAESLDEPEPTNPTSEQVLRGFTPHFPSTLPYSSVRDFAYPSEHPLHYGPIPKPVVDSPQSSQRNSQIIDNGWSSGLIFRRSSDPAHQGSFSSDGDGWGYNWGRESRHQPSPLRFEDGPPWSEDDDLQSPVVRPSRSRRKAGSGQSRDASSAHERRGRKDSEVRRRSEELSNGSNGREVDFNGRAKSDLFAKDQVPLFQEGDDFTGCSFSDQDYDDIDDEDTGDWDDKWENDNRHSRVVTISLGSPEEEMHGRAVALFDFMKENDNELGLVEGQVIWVSYRHGMGWLVAQDPRTGETGLVPEEYVRLLRDIQQHELEQLSSDSPVSSPAMANDELKLQTDIPGISSRTTPILSTFSTSSQDVYPYPLPIHLPGEHPPSHPDHNRSRLGMDSPITTDVTSSTTSQEERVKQIQRERERALLEEQHDTPKYGRKYSVFSNSSQADLSREDDSDVETPTQGPRKTEKKGQLLGLDTNSHLNGDGTPKQHIDLSGLPHTPKLPNGSRAFTPSPPPSPLPAVAVPEEEVR